MIAGANLYTPATRRKIPVLEIERVLCVSDCRFRRSVMEVREFLHVTCEFPISWFGAGCKISNARYLVPVRLTVTCAVNTQHNGIDRHLWAASLWERADRPLFHCLDQTF